MENLISAFPRRKRNWLLELEPLWRALSNGANHTSVAASVRKLLVVFTAPTQLEQSIATARSLAQTKTEGYHYLDGIVLQTRLDQFGDCGGISLLVRDSNLT